MSTWQMSSLVVALAALFAAVDGVPLLNAAAVSAAEGNPPTVGFILDCSRTMNAPLPRGGSVKQTGESGAPTRLEAAKAALDTAIGGLAADGKARVGLWLFGHRLAWEANTDQPDLEEQTDYLAQTQSFQVLAELLPGDDVEAVRQLGPLTADDASALAMRLNWVKPWGEDPLYLAIQRATDSFDRRAAIGTARLVVITDGGDRHGTSKITATHKQVLDAIGRRPVAVHIIQLGSETEVDERIDADLQEIADKSWGTYRKATTIGELNQYLAEAASGEAPAAEPARIVLSSKPVETIPAGKPAESPSSSAVAVQPVSLPTSIPTVQPPPPAPAAKPQTIQGTVIFYKQAVRGAKVTLEGSTAPAATTDASGRFNFVNIAAGAYVIKVEATVKNKIRYATKEITLDPAGAKPLMVEIVLE